MMRNPFHGTGASEIPIVSRLKWAVAGLILGVSATSLAQQPASVLTEADAVRMALARPAVTGLIEGTVETARGEALDAGLWANPVFSYDREQIFGDAVGGSDDFVGLSQEVDLGGRKSLRARAGEDRVRAAEHRGASSRAEIATEARRRFYDVLYGAGRVRAANAWLTRVAEAGVVVEKRAAAGDASTYDHRRLMRERAAAEAKLAEERAALGLARARLAGLLGAEPGSGLEALGDLLPAGIPPEIDDLAARMERRPDLLELASEKAAAESEGRAASRGWVPAVTVGAGLKTSRVADDRGWGFTAGIAVPLPFVSHGQGEAARATGRARVAAARHELVLADAKAEIGGLRAQVLELSEAARTFRTNAVDSSDALARTAEAAYKGGEVGVLELLDAWRSVLDASLQVLDLEVAARRARIELDRTVGEDLR